MKPDSAEPYNALANIYNAQRRFDDAAKMTEEATKRAGDDARRRGSPDQLFNQGVIFWNAGKIPDAKKQFEAALQAKPDMADAHYWVGMANLNEGKLPDAATHFEEYLKLSPTGQYADQAKGVPLADQEVSDRPLADTIAANLAAVRSRIERAARDAGRDPATVRLIAVSKTFGVEHVQRGRGGRAARFRRESRPGGLAEDRGRRPARNSAGTSSATSRSNKARKCDWPLRADPVRRQPRPPAPPRSGRR